MWIRAMLRHAPPTALKVLAENARAMGFSALVVAARVLAASKRPARATTENGPSGRVTPRSGSPFVSRVISRLAPPRSPTSPLESGAPASTPSAA